ncbi:MAG: glycine cleavage T C-terminal barrel domain-containing protein, partial [Bdellovibrionota bacterium]
PKYGVDFTDENLPQEVNLQHAFSRTKGCYIGQEVICKIESFAHVNKHLTGFILEDGKLPPAGAKIFSGGKEAGVLTRAVLSPTLGKPIAFGYVRDKAREEGADLSAAEIRWEGGSAKAREKPGAFVS